jgi:putative Mn2+ efflux pump MntP
MYFDSRSGHEFGLRVLVTGGFILIGIELKILIEHTIG